MYIIFLFAKLYLSFVCYSAGKQTSSGLVQGQLEEDSSSLPISDRAGGSEPDKSASDDRAWNQASYSQTKNSHHNYLRDTALFSANSE